MMRMSVEAKVVRRSGSASQRILTRKADSGSWSSTKSPASCPIAPRQRVVVGRDGPQRRPNEDMLAPPRILMGRFT